MKAMAFRPEGRYQTVRDLVRDLEHWLAGEPATAYPKRKARRLARWLRTPTYAAAAAPVGIFCNMPRGESKIERPHLKSAPYPVRSPVDVISLTFPARTKDSFLLPPFLVSMELS